MNGFSGGFGWMWIIPMAVMMVALLGAVLWGAGRLLYSDHRIGCGRHVNSLHDGKEERVTYSSGEDAEEILARRFAEGKIDYDEFQSRLDVIMRHNATRD